MTSENQLATFHIDCAYRSDIGMRRATNQDSLAVELADASAWSQRGHFLMVADGMGAHAAGELASKMAVDNIPHTYRKLRELSPPAALRRALRKTNDLIHAKGQSSVEFQGMGTTCSCLVLLPDAALVAHVGDSRIYRLRGQQLQQLTFDHSLVWEMAAASQMNAEDVPSCIPKNVITRSLGPHPTVNVDLEGPFDVRPGDSFLLCTDGLTGVVGDELAGVVLNALPPDDAVQTLVDLANLRGGPDNISVVVAKIPNSVEPAAATEGPRDTATFRRRGRTSDAILWATLLVSGLALGWFAARANETGIAISAIVFGATASALLLKKCTSAVYSRSSELGGPYGNGPYRTHSAEMNQEAANALGEIVRQLSDMRNSVLFPVSTHVELDWTTFDQERKRAEQATDEASSLRHYAAAVRELMSQVRRHRRSRTGVEDEPVI